MTILSAKNTPRVSYTATSNQTAFTIPFEFFNITDIKVYKNGTAMTFNSSASTNTTFTVTATNSSSDSAFEFGNGGTVTFGAGVSADDIIVIVRETPIERTSDFPVNGTFDITALNTQQDKFTSMVADVDQQSARSVKLYDYDTVSANVFLPIKATRASKVLSFDSNGNIETTLATTGLSSISGITTEIQAVGAIASNVTTVAGIASNVTSVAGVASNVTTVAGISSNVTTVAGISSNVTSVAGIASNVTTVASNISGVNSFADRYRVASSAPSSSLDEGDLYYDTSANSLNYYNGSAWVVVEAGADVKASVSSNDSTPGFLNGKLVAGTGISLTENNDGSNETLTIANTGGDIAGVTAGTNLSGGGTSGTVTLNLADASTSAKGAASFSSDNFAVSSGAVTIKDLGVATGKIQDDAITLAKMASGTDGNMISYDTSGNPVAVATGSSGQVLTSAGAGAVPSFQTPAGGGKILQVVSGFKNNKSSTTSSSYVAISGLTASLTPASTSSKIFIICHLGSVSTSIANRQQMFAFHRDIGGAGYSAIGESSGSTNNFAFGDNYPSISSPQDTYNAFGHSFLDSPNTTSAVTYKLYHKVYQHPDLSGTPTGAVGGRQADGSYGGACSITIMEVGA